MALCPIHKLRHHPTVRCRECVLMEGIPPEERPPVECAAGYTDAQIKTALTIILQHADHAEADAGFSGEMGDRGATGLRSKVNAYSDGMQRIIPDWMQETIQAVAKREAAEKDPEYVEYLRLQNKFGKP